MNSCYTFPEQPGVPSAPFKERTYRKMTNYLKGFSISLLIHGAVLAAFVCYTPGGSPTEQYFLVVDFSTIALGTAQEGGSQTASGARAGGASGTEASTHAVELAAATPSAPEAAQEAAEPQVPAFAIAAKVAEPLMPPRPKADLRSSLKEKSAKEKNAAQANPQAARSGSRDAPQKRASGEGAPEGGGDERDAGEGRGFGPGSASGVRYGLAQGYITTNFNYILVSIRRHLQYPDPARRRKLTGIAEFTFIIQRDGSIEDLRLQKRSGHSILDEAAEKAIERAAPFPRPPVPARLMVPIEFRMG